MSRIDPLLHALAWMLPVLLLAACGQENQAEEQAAEPEPGAVQVWSFTRATGEGSAMEDRLPASPEQTILVSATTLFPGAARVDPNIQNPFAGDPEAIAAGERHFAAFNCAGCHAPLGGGGMGPPLSDAEWIYGSEPAQIYLSIVQGRAQGMPAFGSMLPGQTVWELVAYIKTLPEIEEPAARLGFDPNYGRFEPAADEGESVQVEQ
jgi:cytochrome c oxidase cbb3-type subunit III